MRKNIDSAEEVKAFLAYQHKTVADSDPKPKPLSRRESKPNKMSDIERRHDEIKLGKLRSMEDGDWIKELVG